MCALCSSAGCSVAELTSANRPSANFGGAAFCELRLNGVLGSPQHRAWTINAENNPYGGCAWQLPSARLPSSRPKER
jgi:hypothetical protein